MDVLASVDPSALGAETRDEIFDAIETTRSNEWFFDDSAVTLFRGMRAGGVLGTYDDFAAAMAALSPSMRRNLW
jgi:hypothetical protein